MKKTFLIIILFTNSFAVFAQEIYEKPVVDERVELMSTVFRLAGNMEYHSGYIQMYINEVDKYFEKYKNHPLIEFSKTLRNEYGVSYDAVAVFSVFLEIKNGKIDFNKNLKIENLDDRWQQDSIPKYIKLLNDFYKKTKFHDFFLKNEKIRKTAEENFAKEITDKVDFNWFKSFFRVLPKKKFRIIISLLNGGSNYGLTLVHKDGSEEFYAIIGSSKTDKNGFPIYEDKNETVINTLIHEICHSFCNPSVFEYLNELLPQATIFYQLNQEKLQKMAYIRPESFLYEIFVRACVLQYNKDQHKYDDFTLVQEVNNGFLWVPQLLEILEKYKNNTNYKTFNDFMPEIVKLQNSIVPQELYDEIEKQKPTITSTNIPNNCDSVDYNLDHIIVYFDTPMIIEHWGMVSGKEEYDYPEFINFKWNDNRTELKIYLLKLEPDTKYQIEFPNFSFVGSNYFQLKNTYTLTFKTRKNFVQ